MSGELKQLTGAPIQGTFNIHVLESRLHFIENGMIKEVQPSEVLSVKVGDDYFATVSGKMMKVLAKSDMGFVAEEVLVDIARLNTTGGAYGSSSNSIATQALSSVEGVGGSRTNMNHMELKNAKDEGSALPVIVKKYLVFPGYVIYATKTDVSKFVQKGDLDPFLKENKIKWKDENSLIKVLDFVAQKLAY